MSRADPEAIMIEPTSEDIGRRVIYELAPRLPKEEGVITSFNDHYVFVRYAGYNCSKATRRENLRWFEDVSR